jgi:transposase
MREVVNALLYVASSGGAWRMLPKCFPPVSTVRRYFYAWRNAGLFETINTVLVMNLREIEGREASPSAGVIDSQSVKTTESGGVWGYDAGKKIRGRKRHILSDTCGFLVYILVHAADIQGRDGAVDVLKVVRFRFPWLRHVFADGGLCRRQAQGRAQGSRKLDDRDHQTLRHRQRLRSAATPMGRRANLCLAGSAQAIGQGLGEIHRKRNRMGAHRLNPNDRTPNTGTLPATAPTLALPVTAKITLPAISSGVSASSASNITSRSL